MVEKACLKCRRITEEKECPECKTTAKLSTRWNGLVVIIDKESELAKAMSLTPGKYALKVK